MRLRNFVLPVLSLLGMGFAGVTAHNLMKPNAEPPLESVPAGSPFERALAGAGLIEPSSEFIAVSALVSGVAHDVRVAPGAKVKKGDVLFVLDDRIPRSDHRVKAAAVHQAKIELLRLESLPRIEEIPPHEARILELEQWLGDDRDRLERALKLVADGALDERDATAARYSVGAREAQLAQARAQLAFLKAGASAADLEVARAKIAAAEASLQAVDAALDVLVIRAPIDGTVLQVNLRVGEFVTTGINPAPVVLGAIEPMHVRIDLDENDASRFRPGARAKVYLRGFFDEKYAITTEFVRVEPYVIPKRVLTGSSLERVDTRVLQAIYRIAGVPEGLPVYCGQQVDVWIEAQ